MLVETNKSVKACSWWHISILLVTAFVCHVVGLLLFLSLQETGRGLAFNAVYYMGIIGIPSVMCVWALVWSRRIGPTSVDSRKTMAATLMEAGWGVLAFVLAGAALVSFRQPLTKAGVLEPYRYPAEYALAIILIAPVYEEVVFRRFLFRFLLIRLGVWRAVLGSSAVFALFHVMGSPVPIVEFCGGVIFCLIYMWRRTLVAPIAVHVGGNLAMALVEHFFSGVG